MMKATIRLPLLAVAFLLAGCASAQFTQSDCMRAALAKHNEYRARHGAPPLEWDEALVAREKVWATTQANAGCGFTTGLDHSPGPENLYAYSAPQSDAEACRVAVENWYSEVDIYRFTARPYTDTMNSMSADEMVGHYTQIVWRSARKVGCYRAQGPDGCTVVGCAYDSGNSPNDKDHLANVKPPGTPVEPNPPVLSEDKYSYCNQFGKSACTGGTTLSGTGELIAAICPVTCGPFVKADRQQWIDRANAMGPSTPSNPDRPAETPSNPDAPAETPSAPDAPSSSDEPKVSDVIKPDMAALITNWGRPDMLRGWYDISCQGLTNDYCRYVNDNNGGVYWSCALAGGKSAADQYTPRGKYTVGNSPTTCSQAKDKHPKCKQWASEGKCLGETYQGLFYSVWCPASCREDSSSASRKMARRMM